MGAKLRAAIVQAFADCPGMESAILSAIGADQLSGVADFRATLCKRLASVLAVGQPSETSPLWGEAIGAASAAAGDPDPHLEEWATAGAPIGVTCPVPDGGVFPLTAEDEPCEAPCGGPLKDNYVSARQHQGKVKDELIREEKLGHVIRFASREDAEQYLEGSCVQSKLACIVKGDKVRIVIDYRRSSVNRAAKLHEAIVLPRPSDAVDAACRLLRQCADGEDIEWAVLDFKDAFKMVPLLPAERRFCGFSFGGEFYIPVRLPFGAKASPLVWGRFAAWLARSAAALGPGDSSIATYVDDPLIVTRGTPAARARNVACVLAWWVALGANPSWKKGQRGQRVRWVGVELERTAAAGVRVSLPAETARRYAELLAVARARGSSSLQAARRMAGQSAWVGAIVPEVRPFARCLWASVAGACADGAAKVGWKRIHHKVRWLEHLYLQATGRGWLSRVYPAWAVESPLVVTTDASPWGMGATIAYRERVLGYVASRITAVDGDKWETAPGRCEDQALWEQLAVLVALRAFRQLLPQKQGVTWRVRSDSMVVVGATTKLSSPDWRINEVLGEVALECALCQARICVDHLPGVKNEVADGLSRMWGPTPSALPGECKEAREVTAQSRGGDFWLLPPRVTRRH